jgi:hypothetical protein
MAWFFAACGLAFARRLANAKPQAAFVREFSAARPFHSTMNADALQAALIVEEPMEPEPQPPSSGRENMLAVALAALVGGMFLFFLYLITLGIVGNVLGIGVLVIAVGILHYLVWGRSMTAEVAAEREALLRQDALEAARVKAPPNAIQDISRTQGIQKK